MYNVHMIESANNRSKLDVIDTIYIFLNLNLIILDVTVRRTLITI